MKREPKYLSRRKAKARIRYTPSVIDKAEAKDAEHWFDTFFSPIFAYFRANPDSHKSVVANLKAKIEARKNG